MRTRTYRTALLSTLLLAGCTPRETMPELTDRVFAVAAAQYEQLEGRLTDETLPRSAASDGKFIPSNIRWWCSGFYPGSLWYIYEYTGDKTFRELAEKNTFKLYPLKQKGTDHDLGFQMNCSFGNAYRITGEQKYLEPIHTSARVLAGRFSPVTGVIRSWDFVRKGRDWKYPVIIDNMMNLEHLYNAGLLFGDDTLKSVAVTHANTTLCNHFRPDFTSYHLVDYDPADGRVRRKETVQGFSDESAWARGQAWALYGYTMMFRLSGYECYLNQAENIAGMLLERLPDDGIPYWDFDSDRIPDDLRDASAAAIMASAFVDLSSLTNKPEEKGRYLKMAEKQLRTLASDAYLARPGENGNFLLMHSVGSRPDNHEIDVPLTYADYYFLEALLKYSRTTQTKPNNNKKTGKWILFMEGMNKMAFNYCDCAPSSIAFPPLWYLAHKFNDQSLLYGELMKLNDGRYTSYDSPKYFPMAIVYASKFDLNSIAPPEEKVWSGKGINPVVLVHDDWTFTDTDKFLGIKAGRANYSHGHMDVGSFVYDAWGTRWSADLGLQSYGTVENINLPGYTGGFGSYDQGAFRWAVFRYNNYNHSTITVNDALHRAGGRAEISSVINTSASKGATIDMTDILSSECESATRTVTLENDTDLVVKDIVKAKYNKAADVRWTMVTRAIPTVEGNRIVLQGASKKLYLKVTSQNNAKVTLKTWSTVGESYDASNAGYYEAGFEAKVTSGQTDTFTVTLSPNE